MHCIAFCNSALLYNTLPDLTLNYFLCRMGKTDVRGPGESSESSQASRGGMSEAVLPFGATLNPLLVHLPSQPARPPTLRECQVIARHLQLINNRQAHEVIRAFYSVYLIVPHSVVVLLLQLLLIILLLFIELLHPFFFSSSSCRSFSFCQFLFFVSFLSFPILPSLTHYLHPYVSVYLISSSYFFGFLFTCSIFSRPFPSSNSSSFPPLVLLFCSLYLLLLFFLLFFFLLILFLLLFVLLPHYASFTSYIK